MHDLDLSANTGSEVKPLGCCHESPSTTGISNISAPLVWTALPRLQAALRLVVEQLIKMVEAASSLLRSSKADRHPTSGSRYTSLRKNEGQR